MAFVKQIPEWNAIGIEPPQSLKDGGWKAGVKPAADYFNWLQNKASEAITELQQKAGEVKTVNGQLPDTNGNVNVNVDTSGFVTTQTLDEHKTDYAKLVLDVDTLKKLKKERSNKDSYGNFTTVTYKRKSDGTIYAKSVLSGGTAPQYTTRTETFYDTDGTTVLATIPYTISYDSEGDWVGEV